MLVAEVIRKSTLKKKEKLEKRRKKKFEEFIDREIVSAIGRGEFKIALDRNFGFSEEEKEVINSYSEVGKFDVQFQKGIVSESYLISWEGK